MSVRIHQLSKQIGMENKELLELLKSRGFEVKSASSTIDNISAESLIEEFSKPRENGEEAVRPPAVEEVSGETSSEEPKGPVFPAGVIVKSAEEIERERQEKLDASKPKPPAPATAARAPAPSPAPTAPKTPPVARPPAAPPSQPPAPSGPPAPPRVTTPPIPPAVPETPVAQESEPSGGESAGGEADADRPVVRVKPPIVVRDFAGEIGLKPFKLISELMEMGIFASMNQTIEEPVALDLAKRHGFVLDIQHRGKAAGPKAEGGEAKSEKEAEDDPRLLESRPPVVCILGHVDHGKTTLLDAIRKANVVDGEAGGITQRIGAYQIEHNGQKITFIDTPGHAAFTSMRQRGANVTDISVLVVAADDAFMPQTDEALRFAQTANNAVIVAINKVDVKGANVDRVKQQMQEKGIAPEDWGGETIAVEVSALKGDHIEDLLDMILLQAEVMELKANPKATVCGTIVEAQVEQGRGASASVIIEKGTLKKGDALLCGEAWCKVKSMMDESGRVHAAAPPGTPVKVTGWSEVPEAGARFAAEKNEKAARRAAEEAVEARRREQSAASVEEKKEAATVEDLFAAIESAQKKSLRIIVKSDGRGSVQALVDSLKVIESPKVDLEVISSGVGLITKNDVTMASAGDAAIVGFNVRLDTGVQGLAKHHDVRIFRHEVIYELIDQVEEAMADLLEAELVEKKVGAAEVRQVFSLGKSRSVAGCMVTEGRINRGGKARLLRGGEVLHESSVATLKRFKDDVTEVRAGYECGINVGGFDDYEEGDVIECLEVEKIRPSLR